MVSRDGSELHPREPQAPDYNWDSWLGCSGRDLGDWYRFLGGAALALFTVIGMFSVPEIFSRNKF
jgi:hypothetical protein